MSFRIRVQTGLKQTAFALLLTVGSFAWAGFEPLTSSEIQANMKAGAGCEYQDNKGTVFAYADSQYLLVKIETGVTKLSPIVPTSHLFFSSPDFREMEYSASDDKYQVTTLRATQWSYDKLVDLEFLPPADPRWIGGLTAVCGAP